MNEVKDMFKPQKDIFENLKSYINENSTLKTWVGKNKISNSNPMIVFKEARNELNTRSTTYDNTTRIMNYNINTFPPVPSSFAGVFPVNIKFTFSLSDTINK